MLISISGIDGAGKTRLGEQIAGYLSADSRLSVIHFPDRTTASGKRIEEMLTRGSWVYPHELRQAFVENRYEKIERLCSSKVTGNLVCVRYLADALVYGLLDGTDREVLIEEEASHNFPKPDLALLLTCDVKVALQRISERKTAAQRYETEELLVEADKKFRDLWRIRSSVSFRYREISCFEEARVIVDEFTKREAM